MNKKEKQVIISKSELETFEIAKKLIRDNSPKLILLIGDLGVGKTHFVKGIAKQLNIKEEVTSPSFLVKSEYGDLIHYDLFMNNKKDKSITNALHEDIEKGLVVIEWANNTKSKFKDFEDVYKVSISLIENNDREIIIERIR